MQDFRSSGRGLGTNSPLRKMLNERYNNLKTYAEKEENESIAPTDKNSPKLRNRKDSITKRSRENNNDTNISNQIDMFRTQRSSIGTFKSQKSSIPREQKLAELREIRQK